MLEQQQSLISILSRATASVSGGRRISSCVSAQPTRAFASGKPRCCRGTVLPALLLCSGV
jgi:hypothetical protein